MMVIVWSLDKTCRRTFSYLAWSCMTNAIIDELRQFRTDFTRFIYIDRLYLDRFLAGSNRTESS